MNQSILSRVCISCFAVGLGLVEIVAVTSPSAINPVESF